MFPQEMIDDADKFKYYKGDEFDIFGIRVRIENKTWASHTSPNDSSERLYSVYVPNLDGYTVVSEEFLDNNGKEV